MKHEIIELHNVQIIGMAKKGGACDVDNIVGGHLAFNEAKEECPKFWGEYVEKIIKPVVFEKQAPNTFQQVAFANGVGEFGLCTCDIPNHNCATLPDEVDELKRTLEAMDIDYYKPAVKCARNRILSGKIEKRNEYQIRTTTRLS